jgi:hypothetical protein
VVVCTRIPVQEQAVCLHKNSKSLNRDSSNAMYCSRNSRIKSGVVEGIPVCNLAIVDDAGKVQCD